MRRAPLLTLLCCALSGAALAQQPSPPDAPAPAPAALQVPQPQRVETQTGQEAPPAKEPLYARAQRLLDDFNQRHQQRVLEMSSYDKAGEAEPGLKQFADPRKVELELKDERDRQQTSEALANEYGEEATEVHNQEQAVQDFIAKRQKTLDELSKQVSAVNRQDLQVAAANLARQPGTDAQVRAMRSRLAEADVNEQKLAAQRPQGQQEISSAEEELKKLRALEQSLEKESKAYAADATSARQNQLNLADRLEFYVVRAKAEDVLDQDLKATETVQHLAASPEVHDTLASPAPSVKANAKPDAKCAQSSPDGKGCAETAAKTPKE